jgi:hypothetical protein
MGLHEESDVINLGLHDSQSACPSDALSGGYACGAT